MKNLFDDFTDIIGVSKVASQSVIDNLSITPEKVKTIYNTFAVETIKSKSKSETFEVDKNKINFVSVGRFAKQKMFLRAISVADMLKSAGVDFHWYIIGNGDEFIAVENRVKELNVSDCVTLTGTKSNPYPIIDACDCLVIPSLYEAHPMVANEAFILKTPVISTLYPSTSEVINNGVNGIICENSEEGIYCAMKEFAEDKMLRDKLSANLSDFEYDNETIIKQIQQLFT